uniref:Uncharacterized protein n=1 Tax=Photinus pyralis TaxID=7054 RepID=A0A1Y1NI86_PHOPY
MLQPTTTIEKIFRKTPRHEMTALQQESIQYVGSPPSSSHQKSTTTARDQDVVSGTGSSPTPPLILVLNAKRASVVVSLVFFFHDRPPKCLCNLFLKVFTLVSSSREKIVHVLLDWGNG